MDANINLSKNSTPSAVFFRVAFVLSNKLKCKLQAGDKRSQDKRSKNKKLTSNKENPPLLCATHTHTNAGEGNAVYFGFPERLQKFWKYPKILYILSIYSGLEPII